ncbi:MAG: cobaltochelatase CobT-related protein [Opitutia bacterium]|jgi:Mg-chelatase subunit ChlD
MLDMTSPAEAIASLFADRHGVKPTVKIDPKASPCWNSATNTIYLPGWPAEGLTPTELQQLRAYLWHEAAGEQALNTWHTDPRLTTTRRRRLANGIGDAYLDTSILQDRPGAGTDIRREVRADFDRMVKETQKNPATPSVGLASCLCRYVGEGVTSWNEVRQSVRCTDPALFDYIEPVFPTGTVLRNGDDVLDRTMAVDAALDRYLQDQPEPPQPDAPSEEEASSESTDGEADGNSDSPDSGETDGKADGNSDSNSDSNSDGNGDGEADTPPQQGDESLDKSSGKGKPNDSGNGEAETGDGEADTDGTEAGSPNGSGATNGGRAKRPDPTQFDADGVDSGDRMAKQLADTLTTNTDGNGAAKLQIPDTTLREVDARNATYPVSADLKSAATALANMLRSALSAPSMATDRFQEVGRLDSRRMAAGMAGVRTIYQRRREIPGQSVAVDVVIDNSGSMSDHGRMNQAKRLAATMMLAFGKMTDVKLNVSGFTTGETNDDYTLTGGQPRYQALLTMVQRFDDPAESGLKKLNALVPDCGTPTMQAIYAGMKRLVKRPERRRILFVLTDGEASYEETSTSNRWRLNPIKLLKEQADRAGVEVVVFAIDNPGAGLAKCGLDVVPTTAGSISSIAVKQLIKLLTIGSRKVA